MALVPISISARMEPLDEPDPTAADVMCRCDHMEACRRILELLDGPVDEERLCWMNRLAARLGCADCEEWDG